MRPKSEKKNEKNKDRSSIGPSQFHGGSPEGKVARRLRPYINVRLVNVMHDDRNDVLAQTSPHHAVNMN